MQSPDQETAFRLDTPEPVSVNAAGAPSGWDESPSWDALLDLLLRVERGEASVPETKAALPSFAAGVEAASVVIGCTASTTLPDDTAATLTAPKGKSDNVVVLGWPTLAFPAPDGRGIERQPLLLRDVQIERDGKTVTTTTAGPQLNPLLLHRQLIDDEPFERIEQHLGGSLPLGDEAAMTAAVQAALSAIGCAASDVGRLDPSTDAATEMRSGNQRSAGPIGVSNLAVAMLLPRKGFTKRLIEELETLRKRSDWHETAAAFLPRTKADPAAPSTMPQAAAPALRNVIMPPALPLNASQEAAANAAATQPLTVISGPPGTGKSQVVAAIVAAARVRGESVLIASTNNNAVEQATDRANRSGPGLLLRTGKREIQEKFREEVEKLAATAHREEPHASEEVRERSLTHADHERFLVLDGLEERSRLQLELETLLQDMEQLRLLLWRDVGRELTDRELAALQRRCLRLQRRWLADRRRRRILRQAGASEPGVEAEDVAALVDRELRVRGLLEQLAAAGPSDPDSDRAALREADSRWQKASDAELKFRLARWRTALGDCFKTMPQRRNSGESARHRDMEQLVGAGSGLACTSLSLASNFPLKPALFDLVVLDEASQCTIGSILPLAYRARRMVIVGDSNQLSPVVTLPRSAIASIARLAGTNVDQLEQLHLHPGKGSAFTALAARSDTPEILLAEHYRCTPRLRPSSTARSTAAVSECSPGCTPTRRSGVCTGSRAKDAASAPGASSPMLGRPRPSSRGSSRTITRSAASEWSRRSPAKSRRSSGG